MDAFVPKEHFKTTLARDVYGLLVGDYIDKGAHRSVYTHASLSDAVVKFENRERSFCNVYEHQVWNRIKDTEFAKWFAPVIDISANGVVLIMRRTTKVEARDLPTHVPAFFTDLQPCNFGWMDGRIVCHDYGWHRLIERGMTKKMRRATWAATHTLTGADT